MVRRKIERRKMIIGITGNTGGGKGAAAALLAERGALVLDADQLAHEVILPGREAYQPVLDAFGPELLSADNTIDRGKLGAIVFRDPAKLRQLEAIVHQAVTRRMMELLTEAGAGPWPFVVIDAPLLIEAGLHRICDRVWLVTAEEGIRRQRIMERDHLTGEQADLRLKNQVPDEKREPFADSVIVNNGNMEELRGQVERAMKADCGDLPLRLSQFMAGMGVDYAICGGHAIDLFLGRKTRPHKDADVAVFWEDRDNIVRQMLDGGWELYEPCGAEGLHKITNVGEQRGIKANIWCVQRGNSHYQFTALGKDMYAVTGDDSEQTELDYIEVLFNTRRDGKFLFARNHDIKMSLTDAVALAEGIPYLAPELVLLYKSSAADVPAYQLDFENAVPRLTAEQASWLKNALMILYPGGHPWLEAEWFG